MNFLFVEHHPIFGGPHNRAIVLAQPLSTLGWETIALLPDEPGTAAERYREAGVEVELLRLSRVRRSVSGNQRLLREFWSDVGRIRHLIRRKSIDLVVVCGLESPQGAIAAWRENLPVVWQINGTQTPLAFRRAMMPIATRIADVIMTTGTTIAKEHPGIQRAAERLVPFFSPVDVKNRFSPNPAARDRARLALGLRQDDLVVGTVGNVNPQKGHGTFISAAGELRQRHPAARFVILGTHGEIHNAYAEGLWAKATGVGLQLGRDLIVQAAGTKVAELASAFDIFWFTSVPRSEGVPTAVMEAMALALPVVSTEVGGIRDIVSHGRTGFLVPPYDSAALAEATEALVLDSELRVTIGGAGRAFAIERCAIEHCVAAHVKAFDLAIKSRRPHLAAGKAAASR